MEQSKAKELERINTIANSRIPVSEESAVFNLFTERKKVAKSILENDYLIETKECLTQYFEQIEERLKTDTCSKCNSNLKQTRSGSKVVQCINEECKARFQYKSKKK